MSRSAILGAFIFGALLIFGLAVFLIGDRQFTFGRTYLLKAPFTNVAGLDEGATVRVGGVRIGLVEKIRLPQRSGEQLIVEMKLDENTRGLIGKDSVASIETEGLLGNKYIALSFGTEKSQSARDGDTIASVPPFDFSDLARKADKIADQTSAVMAETREVLSKAEGAVENVDAMTANLKSVSARINRGEGTIGALVNDRQVYQSLNAAAQDIRQTMAAAQTGMVSFQENMEALKHNWFFRGFFKDRGWFDSSELTAHAITETPQRPVTKKFILDGDRLFDNPDDAKLDKEKMLDEVGKFLEANPFELVVILAYKGLKGDAEENLKLTQARAMVIREYLVSRFRIDDGRIKTRGMGEDRSADPGSASRIEILVYADVQKTAAQQ
jgi:phospholipid/cholesterol/gamma-HCH transport system substrate-binding protein